MLPGTHGQPCADWMRAILSKMDHDARASAALGTRTILPRMEAAGEMSVPPWNPIDQGPSSPLNP
jgi:hypothetical protein